MQVLDVQNNTIGYQQQTLINLFQRFIEISSDDYEGPSSEFSSGRQQINQNIKREWNYFKEQISSNPLNTDRISSYFYLLEKNQIANNNTESSPVSSPLVRPSSFQKEMSASSKSPNTRFMTMHPQDVPKDAFKKIKRSFNKSNNSNIPMEGISNAPFNQQQPPTKQQQPEGYYSPQVQPTSDKYFSQAVQHFEKSHFRNSRSPLSNHNGNPSSQHSFTVASSSFGNQYLQQQIPLKEAGQIQQTNQIQSSPDLPGNQQSGAQQFSNQQIQTPSPPNNTSTNVPSTADTIGNQSAQRGLIKVDDTTFSPPSFPVEQLNKLQQQQQQQYQQQQQQQQINIVSKFSNNEASSSHSESSSTRNSQDIINNNSHLQQNNTVYLGTNAQIPSLNTTVVNNSNTSMQIENLKNHAQQFYKDYKNQQQIDSSRSNLNQQDSSRNAITSQTSQSNSSFQQQQIPSINSVSSNPLVSQQQQQQSDQQTTSLNQIQQMDGQRQQLHNPYLKVVSTGFQSSHSHSLEHTQGINSQPHQQPQYRMYSPNPQSSEYNRVNSPVGRFGLNSNQQTTQLPPTNPTKNALNYKNKMLQAANQAVPLNQISSNTASVQPKSDSFTSYGGTTVGLPITNILPNNGLASQPSSQQQYGAYSTENQSYQGQRFPSPTRVPSGITPIASTIPKQQQQQTGINPTAISEQQAIIDEMLRYQFKTKSVLEKTQLLETYMKNNSTAINSLFNTD